MTEVQPPPRATVREIDGQIVLDDPDGLAVVKAVSKHNCKNTFRMQAERVEYFAERAGSRPGPRCVIVLLNVNDELGGAMAEVLMPGNGQRWQELRDAGEVPFARGLARRDGMEEALRDLDGDAAEKLRVMSDVLPVIVMDHGVIEVFRADGRDVEAA